MMEIDPRPPGLIKRWMFHTHDHEGNVVVEEIWDINVPGCPLIRNPFDANPLEMVGGIVKRQMQMSIQEFRDSKIPLFG